MEGTLDRDELNRALSNLRRLAGAEAGAAFWTFTRDGVQLAWGGMSFAVGGAVDGEGNVRLVSNAMQTIVGAPFKGRGPVKVRVADDRLRLDSTSFRCELTDRPAPQLLPLDAQPFDTLLLAYVHPRETIEDAGLAARVDELMEQKHRIVEKAAETLGRLRIDAETVSAWVEAHLQAVARGARTFEIAPKPKTVVLDPKGQVSLL